MTKAYSRFISAFFAVFLAGFLIFHLVLPDKTHSETENRTLAQFPAFSWEALKSGSFTKDLEEYFADQFPLRDGWTGLKARAEQLLGKSVPSSTNVKPSFCSCFTGPSAMVRVMSVVPP